MLRHLKKAKERPKRPEWASGILQGNPQPIVGALSQSSPAKSGGAPTIAVPDNPASQSPDSSVPTQPKVPSPTTVVATPVEGNTPVDDESVAKDEGMCDGDDGKTYKVAWWWQFRHPHP